MQGIIHVPQEEKDLHNAETIEMIKQRITQVEIFKPKEKVLISNTDTTLTEVEQNVLTLLKKGYQYSAITNLLDLSKGELSKIVKLLKIKNVIDSEQIQQARDIKRVQDEEDVISYLKKGYGLAEILAEKGELNKPYLTKMIGTLKKQGRITNEEIEYAQSHNSRMDDLKPLVLEGLKNGLTVKQIIESDETRVCNPKSCS